MSRNLCATLLVSGGLAAGACQKSKPAPQAGQVSQGPGEGSPGKKRLRSRWDKAEVIAGDRSGVTPGATAPKHSLWESGFEGKDARDVKLTLPYMAVQDDSGRVYIADKVAHSVRWVDEIQEIHTAAGTGRQSDGSDAAQPGTACGLSFPNALWVHPSGRLYVLDFGNAKLRRLDPSGKIETIFQLPKDLKGGRGLAVSADESLIYVAAKDRIYRYDGQGKPRVFAQGFVNLGHLALLPSGELYAADRDAGYVYQLSPSGDRKVIAGDGTVRVKPGPVPATKQGLNQPRGLAFVPGLGLLIATQGGRSVYRLNPAGSLERILDGVNPSKTPEGPYALRIDQPLGKLRGLFVARNGDLLLTHGDLGQVLRFKKATQD